MKTIAPGFENAVLGAQQTFRAMLQAMAEPARPVDIEGPEPPAPLARSSWALALTLFDHDTPVWLDPATRTGSVPDSLRFHCGCPVVEASAEASFAILTDLEQMPPLEAFNPGSLAYPDRAATLILQGVHFGEGPEYRFTGPGIRDATLLRLSGLRQEFWQDWEVNISNFPSGVDVVLATDRALVGLPRTIDCREHDHR